jgi:glycine dehydrogenase
MVISDDWSYPYSREKAAYPMPWLRRNKFWPSVGRVNNAYGDRNLVCSCPPVSDYEEAQA